MGSRLRWRQIDSAQVDLSVVGSTAILFAFDATMEKSHP